MSTLRAIVAGGGTGGHLFPGMAIAEEIQARGGHVVFVGTARGLEAKVVPAAGYTLELLDVSGLKRAGAAGVIRGLARLPRAYLQSRAILARHRPNLVVGVGGYASGPLVLAAALAGVATFVQEQNSVPGFTNRMLGKLARQVFTAFPEAAEHFPPHKVALLGNPVRRALVEALAPRAGATDRAAGPGRVLVVGGSQGARAVNDLVIEAARRLDERGALPAIVHQVGAADLDRATARYREEKLAGRVEVKAFIDDMAAAYGDADLVIARAGALTLAELAIAGRPAILIPLPTAADDHQSKNARAFEQAGAAMLMAQEQATGEMLAEQIASLLEDAERLRSMTAVMRTLARPRAAQDIVDRLQGLV